MTLSPALLVLGCSRQPAGRLWSVTEISRPIVAPEAWTAALHSSREEIRRLQPGHRQTAESLLSYLQVPSTITLVDCFLDLVILSVQGHSIRGFSPLS